MTPERFVAYWALVSGAGALGAIAILDGAGSGATLLLVGGVVMAILTLAGVFLLARVVFLSERDRGRQ